MSRFGNGSNSNGQFWYGSATNFPGFLYKKNLGVGGRRSTKFGAGGNSTTNTNQYLYNKYTPGQNGIGASSVSTRRAKNRHASICNKNGVNNCYPCYMTLGQYNRFLYNPNGFYPCPAINSYSIPTPQPTVPSAPTLLSLTPTDEHLILNFIIGSDQGSSITDIEYSTDNGITWTSSGQTSSPFVITGLTNGVSYQVGIRSKNIYGTSSPSNFISGIPNPYIESYLTVGTTSWTVPTGVTSVEYLVVGGGGGSGATHDGGGAGGGGSGMVLTGTLPVVSGNIYSVVVGDGGAGGIGLPSPSTRETDGSPGQSSQFSTIIALGGGEGYRSRFNGSGTGGASSSDPSTASVGGYGGTFNNGGGGGGGDSGAGSNGVIGAPRTGGAGGSGTTSSISGVSVSYGVGGSGGTAQTNDNAEAGASNRGNGANGPGTPFSSQRNGAKGGSGIVIIKF
jgi:hypothetical protein